MFDETKFLTGVKATDTSSNDLTAAEMNALVKLFYYSADLHSGLWDLITYSFQCGFKKGQESA